MFVNCRR